MCLVKENGELGIRSLFNVNSALVGNGYGDLQKRRNPFGKKSSR